LATGIVDKGLAVEVKAADLGVVEVLLRWEAWSRGGYGAGLARDLGRGVVEAVEDPLDPGVDVLGCRAEGSGSAAERKEVIAFGGGEAQAEA